MGWFAHAQTVAVLALGGVSGCEGPGGCTAASTPRITLRCGGPVQRSRRTVIPWFELRTGVDRMVEGRLGWFDDHNGDGQFQGSEPYEPALTASPAIPTRMWRSGRLYVPKKFRTPALLACVTLESGIYRQRVRLISGRLRED